MCIYIHTDVCISCTFQALGVRLGSFIEITVILVASLIIALIYSWSLTLIILGLVPLIAVAQGMQTRLEAGATKSVKKVYEDSANVCKFFFL